jgi:glycosyltransferase involved in cell wall biosynthesis
LRFLFLFAGPNKIGGIETLIARMGAWLIGQGHAVCLLTNAFSECRSFMPKEMRVAELGADYEKLALRRTARALWKDLAIETPDVIKAFNLSDAWNASVLAGLMEPTPRLLCGVYNPVFLNGPGKTLRHLRQQLWEAHFIRHLPDAARLFMAEEQIDAMRRLYGEGPKGQLFLLPIDPGKINPGPRRPAWGKIVSIGRLDPMKGYNLYMVDIVKSLREKGYDIRWEVFGDGEPAYKARLRERIGQAGLGGHISLRGNVEYAELGRAVGDAWLFVGMGTAVVEAAVCGVPNVVAIAFDTGGKTLGPIYRFPLGNHGEPGSEGAFTRVEAEIERILGLDGPAYAEESRRVQEHVRPYHIDASMRRFLEYSEAAPTASMPPWLGFLYNFTHYWIHLKKAFGRQ